MKQEQDRELWVNGVMESLDGTKRPEANPFLYEKIMYKMTRGAEQVARVPGKVAWGWAMALVMLLALNGFSIVSKITHEKRAVQAEAVSSLLPDMNLQTIYNY